MKMLEADFNFHPIGQGCFYSGLLSFEKIPSLRFNFVYDCGTDSIRKYLEEEIDDYKNGLVGNDLDLLVISHFDADHVNGVSKLLDGIRCRRVIIPYYEPIERLLLSITSNKVDEDYLRFLQNPISFLSNPDRFRVDEIIIIGGPPEEGEVNNLNPENTNPIQGKSLEEFVKDIGDLKELRCQGIFYGIDDSDSTALRIRRLEPADTNFTEVKFLAKPYKVQFDIWEYFFYLKKHDNFLLIKKFTDDVNHLLSANGLSIFDLFDEDNVEELKKIYRSYYGQNLNCTSLVTFHGPLFNSENYQHHFYGYDWFWCNKERTCGTLLTGDIDLNSKKKTNALIKYFNSYLDQVCIFQIPHHGSKYNWYRKHPNGLESFCNYIINHGVGRKSHPSPEVIEYLKANCHGTIHLNNEVKNLNYGFNFYFP
ncbi:MAG: MBL fold metallo-hydrolase [Chitinophagales bacterium]|nr:MBL fold metallo-hydrolase [Chitinophagales bacterium]